MSVGTSTEFTVNAAQAGLATAAASNHVVRTPFKPSARRRCQPLATLPKRSSWNVLLV
jgi:hypothetical protein